MSALDTRNTKRSSLFMMADVAIGGGAPARVKVRNLSDTGLMADVPHGTQSGQAVTVTLRNIGAVPGRIAWVQGTRCGIAFDAPIDASRAQVRPTDGAGTDPAVRTVHRLGALEVPWHQRPEFTVRKV